MDEVSHRSGSRLLPRARSIFVLAAALHAGIAGAESTIEKPELTLGFIKLTDCAPIIVAYEKGYFEDEGLYVTLEAQANWKLIVDRVIDGSLDGAHMLAPQPLGASLGIGTRAELVTPYSMDLNGNAITVSNAVWEEMRPHIPSDADGRPRHPISAGALRPVIDSYREAGLKFNLAMVFPLSTHNYELRYWLAAGGIHPGYYSDSDSVGQTDGDVLIAVTPPPQMPATLASGTISGYAVGEPWNQQAVFKGLGVPVVTDHEIWQNNPEKVFGVTREFAESYPNTLVALVKALLRAAQWLDEEGGRNRAEAVAMLARPEYVGADAAVIANSMTGTFEYERGDKRPLPNFNVFFRNYATYPFYSDAVWYLTQMRRWGQIAQDHGNDWYDEVARQVYRPDIYREAAEALIAEGRMKAEDLPETDGYRPPTDAFIDGVLYDGRKPNEYLRKLAIGHKPEEEVQ